ncbi:MAG TPA: O-antigen ligase family protein [Thermoleophilaceae bacterium]|nr:O-antigen ligase family protein [Thermoleophilaceae bacterium]
MSRLPSATASFFASAALAAALFGVAVGARGGTALERTVAVELLMLAAGSALICAAIAFGRRGRFDGGVALAAFAALAAITAISVGWSIAPDLSYVEAGRTLAYLATFAGGIALARLAPSGAAAVARGVVLAAVAVCAYGLSTRVWPASFAELAFSGRIGQPFDYWNALAGVAAVGIVPALWLGARRAGAPLGRALAFPATGLLIATLLIAQSRGALVAAAVGCALWLVLVPLRLRSVVVLIAAGAGAAPVVAWATSKDPFRIGLQPLSAREAVAGEFGLMLVALVLVLLAVGALVQAVGARAQPSLRARFRAGAAVAVVVALVPLALVTSVATSDRGLSGTVSDRIDELTDDSAAPPTGSGRLQSLASERFAYWREAFDAFEERPLSGLGAGSFELARLAHRDSGGGARRAHGFVPQTLSDIGLLGGLTALLLLAAWLVAAARATGLRPRCWWRPLATARPPWTGERAALAALALAAVVYGVQSATDWTWFVPGLTAIALVAAGFVAGRGPLTGAPSSGAESWATSRRRPTPARLLGCAALALPALVCGWAFWQPVAADRALARSYDLTAEGEPVAALREAADARDLDPRTVEPFYAAATALIAIDRPRQAIANLRRAAAERPRDPEPWLRIAAIQLDRRNAPAAAFAAAGQVLRRDPHSRQAIVLYENARQLLIEQREAAAGPPATTTP